MFFLTKVALVLLGTAFYLALRLLYGKQFALLYIQETFFRKKPFVYIRPWIVAVSLGITIAVNTR